jgi:predicted GNAT family N-acyltransferase|tara:strand:+ start:9887 stop:10324 length:438 start_codon:yes stop_codon:yes gene_type:complete
VSEIEFRAPKNSNELKEYDLFRWSLLRKPIGKSIESLKDKYDSLAFHLIGIKQGKIVACGRLHFNNLNEAQIRYMAVDNSLQKQGIGKKILVLLEEKAKKKNAKKIILNARNHAVMFYKKSGYAVLGKYTGSDTEIPHTSMEKCI